MYISPWQSRIVQKLRFILMWITLILSLYFKNNFNWIIWTFELVWFLGFTDDNTQISHFDMPMSDYNKNPNIDYGTAFLYFRSQSVTINIVKRYYITPMHFRFRKKGLFLEGVVYDSITYWLVTYRLFIVV